MEVYSFMPFHTVPPQLLTWTLMLLTMFQDSGINPSDLGIIHFSDTYNDGVQ